VHPFSKTGAPDLKIGRTRFFNRRKGHSESGYGKSTIKEDLLVVGLKTGKQMRIREQLENSLYKCYSGNFYVGNFEVSELMEFNKWVNEVYNKR
jgi:hypothetical protein